jgi:hypothetical protein
VAACAGAVAVVIPRAPIPARAPALGEVGAASPLAEPAYSQEEF